MSATDFRFDANDLKDELRHPEAWDDDEFWYVPEDELPDHLWTEDDGGRRDCPILDPMHGRIYTPCPHVVQVMTDRDIYHELVQWLDEVFEIPRGYDVHWLDYEYNYGDANLKPHAVIVLRDDSEVIEHGEDEGFPIRHLYKRGEHAGKMARGEIRNGRIHTSGQTFDSLTAAAEHADGELRSETPDGYNGWQWWEYANDQPFTLDYLRGSN